METTTVAVQLGREFIILLAIAMVVILASAVAAYFRERAAWRSLQATREQVRERMTKFRESMNP